MKQTSKSASMTLFKKKLNQSIFGEKKIKEEKMKESFDIQKKVMAPKLIAKLDLGFGCRYQNQVSVVHLSEYTYAM